MAEQKMYISNQREVVCGCMYCIKYSSPLPARGFEQPQETVQGAVIKAFAASAENFAGFATREGLGSEMASISVGSEGDKQVSFGASFRRCRGDGLRVSGVVSFDAGALSETANLFVAFSTALTTLGLEMFISSAIALR